MFLSDDETGTQAICLFDHENSYKAQTFFLATFLKLTRYIKINVYQIFFKRRGMLTEFGIVSTKPYD